MRGLRSAVFNFIFVISLLAMAWPARAQMALKPVITSGLSQPLYVTAPPGDNNRLFIVEKTGAIRIFNKQTNTLLTTPYLSVPVDTNSERGLLGLAFDPDFANNGRFYVDYTRSGGPTDVGDIIVARYTANGNPMTSNVANATGQQLLTIEHTSQGNHNGGWIGFRPNDGNRLYIAVGDGGSGNDPPNNGQNTNVLLGKMLRIDVSGSGAYTIPTGNLTGGAPEIYHYGLRNPWRNSFDRETGDLFIGDVGQSAMEEIDFQRAGTAGGLNFGWRSKEGTNITGLNGPGPFTGLTDPIHSYGRSLGASTTGGYVYRGPIPSLQGLYFYGDYISGRTWTFRFDGTTLSQLTERTNLLTATGGFANQLSSWGEDASGNLYMVAIGRGAVYQVVPEPGTLGVMLGAIAVLMRRRRAR
jgi:glucose/arabinose dehydrogenase